MTTSSRGAPANENGDRGRGQFVSVERRVSPTISFTGGDFFSVGETGQLTAIERLTSTTTQDVTATATWQSSNPSVATVSAIGVVTAVAIGSSIVTASNQGVAESRGNRQTP